MAEGIPADARRALVLLGDAVLPIEDWLPPPGKERADWDRQNGRRVSIEDLGALDVIERLIREEDAEVDERWNRLDRDAVAVLKTVVPDVPAWRKERGLLDQPRFRMDGTNWPTPVDTLALQPPDGAEGEIPLLPNPVSRPRMYAAAWKPLVAVAKTIGTDVSKWAAFSGALLKEDATALKTMGWDTPPSFSSRFLRLFVRDLLIATMGMKNVAIGPMAFAFLVELQEARRVGNAYTREDVDVARGAFDARLREIIRTQPPVVA